MDNQDSKDFKINMESLKSAFKANVPDDCPMADTTMAFALGELDSKEEDSIREHINTCRYCLDLFLDTRAAETDSKEPEKKQVEVLPGLKKAMEPEAPSVWSKIQKVIPDSFKNLFTGILLPKQVAIYAACCLVLMISIYGIWDRIKNGETLPINIEMALMGRSVTGYIDGLRGKEPKYEIVRLENGGTLKSGDSFRITAKLDQEAHVFLIYRDSTGQISAI